MSDTKQLAQKFLDALAANAKAKYEEILSESAGMRIERWDGGEAYRPRTRVIEKLMGEWSAWIEPRLETFSLIADDERAAAEFRIQAMEKDRYMEHNRAAFLVIKDDKIQTIDLYCPEPQPSARRKGWIAPANLNDDEINRLFDSLQFAWDIREWIPPNFRGFQSPQIRSNGTDDSHPGSNFIGAARWTAGEADQRIEEIVTYHRERNIGFTWFVSSHDTPADLSERLERHGLVLAGDQAVMARVGLENLDDIPTNPNVEIELVDGSNEESVEAILQMTAVSFHWTAQQIDERRPGFLERIKNPEFRKIEVQYLARLNGKPVADARVVFRGGIAYLGGASTLPEYRGQKIYSTLLRRRLEEARARGYNIAAIHAEPMSRRVVKRYSFKEYAKAYVYAWMPVIDMDVIRSLVPDD